MKNNISAEYTARLLFFHGKDIAQQVESDIPKALEDKLPASWLDVLRDPSAATIRGLWAPAREHLPGFINYLAHSVEGAAVVEAYGAIALLLALSDWIEEDMQHQPGFCWVGLPTDSALIETFIKKVGPIPPSLENLWRVANFINTKHPSMICSLDPAAHQLTEEPEVFSVSSHSSPTQCPLECLKIAAVNGQMVTCMTRPPGQAHWDDVLVEKFRHADEFFYGGKSPLDCMLTDNWEPSLEA
jgi:hypothetical protein